MSGIVRQLPEFTPKQRVALGLAAAASVAIGLYWYSRRSPSTWETEFKQRKIREEHNQKLIDLLKSESTVEKGLDILIRLTGDGDRMNEIGVKGGMAALVPLLSSKDPETQGRAAWIVANMCTNPDAGAILVNEGGLDQVLFNAATSSDPTSAQAIQQRSNMLQLSSLHVLLNLCAHTETLAQMNALGIYQKIESMFAENFIKQELRIKKEFLKIFVNFSASDEGREWLCAKNDETRSIVRIFTVVFNDPEFRSTDWQFFDIILQLSVNLVRKGSEEFNGDFVTFLQLHSADAKVEKLIEELLDRTTPEEKI